MVITIKGLPIRIVDISGWDPQIIILVGESSNVNKYIENPRLDLEKRFSSYIVFVEPFGLDYKLKELKQKSN